MPQSDANFETGRPNDQFGEPVDAVDLFEQMLEAEIMGSGTRGADPDLDLIEERLSQLRRVPEPHPVAVEPLLEIEPLPEIKATVVSEPVAEFEDLEPLPPSVVMPVPPTPAPAPQPAPVPVRPSAPAVVVAGNRPATMAKHTSSADTVVLEAARAAGVAPAYRQPAASPKPQAQPAARKHRRRSSRLPSFYFAVLALLLVSFALFAVWRPVYDELIDLPDAQAGSVAEVAPTMPVLPVLPAKTEAQARPVAPVDLQTTASVNDLPAATVNADFPATTSREGYAARRIVKLYRVDAQGNIIGLPPSP